MKRRSYRGMARAAVLAIGAAALSGGMRSRQSDALLVMSAASITRPVRALLDSFSAHTGIKYQLEPGASLEVARRLTDLHRTPDVLLLADPAVFPDLLMPAYVHWYAVFARNRIVLAYTNGSRGANRIDADNWPRVIMEPAVEVGRANPNTDPSGYRALLAMQLAERFYREPGLYARLLAAAPERNVRPREADQVALLQTRELDYIWTYQNLAENDGLRYVKLPDEIDLGNLADSGAYVRASTRVLGAHLGDTITVRGTPILFGLSIPAEVPHRAAAERFVSFVFSPQGQRVMRSQHLDAVERPFVVGTDVPSAVRSAVRARAGER
jgi:molybdate/tungstate transport system substrate-binding protein